MTENYSKDDKKGFEDLRWTVRIPLILLCCFLIYVILVVCLIVIGFFASAAVAGIMQASTGVIIGFDEAMKVVFKISLLLPIPVCIVAGLLLLVFPTNFSSLLSQPESKDDGLTPVEKLGWEIVDRQQREPKSSLPLDSPDKGQIKKLKNINSKYNHLSELTKNLREICETIGERRVFNPTINSDYVTINSGDFKLLNDFGLISEKNEYPYLKYIDLKLLSTNDDMLLDNYVKGRKLKMPILLPLDSLERDSTIETGVAFEKYVANILRGIGFNDVEVLKSTGDYGVDILATKEKIVYAIQCKYYSNNVPISAIQEIMGGKRFYNAHLAVVVTNSHFTTSAQNLAEANSIILWDCDDLKEMMLRFEENASKS